MRYYQVDIDDLHRGRLTPRRVAVLVAGLPLESATARAVHGPAASWTRTDHLLALVVDRLAILSWQIGGNPKAPRQWPLPRPGVNEAIIRHGRTNRPTAQVVAYLHRFAPVREEVSVDG